MSTNTFSHTSEDFNNVYASNLMGEEIHISLAESGRKGYYCLGCKREMQAVIASIEGRMSYFRHDAKAVKGQRKCTYSDETYRHKIAKEILSRIKMIKVPAVYKYPPSGEEGKIYLLSESRIIEADSVGIEKSFYEDENGQIHYQASSIPIEEKYLLIRPDITFFDANQKPLLFIEIVATHKITDEKKVKLKRLGIDTVQIQIPKYSPQEIENSFFITKYIKWIYNDEEQRTEYLSIPEGSAEGISSIDEEQRKLFEETLKCRAAQINNLIRTINRCLGSELYRGIEGGLGSELSRVEGNTEEHSRQWESIQRGIQLEIEEQYRKRREKFTREQEQFDIEAGKFQQYSKDLGRRYHTKRKSLENSISDIEQPIEARRRDLERETARVDADIRAGRRRIEQIQSDHEGLENSLRISFESAEKYQRGEIERIQSLLDEAPSKFANDEKSIRTEFEHLEEKERREISNCEKFEEGYGDIVEEGRRDVAGRFENIRTGIIRSIKARIDTTNSEFARKLKDVINNGALLLHFEEAQINFRRYRQAWECFKEGTYENWK